MTSFYYHRIAFDCGHYLELGLATQLTGICLAKPNLQGVGERTLTVVILIADFHNDKCNKRKVECYKLTHILSF